MTWLMSFLGNPLMLLALKSVGAGMILKFLLSTKVGNKEAIDYLPKKYQPWVSHVVALVVYGVYGSITGHYVGPDGGTNLTTDVVTTFFTGASATWTHNVLTTLLPILSQANEVLGALAAAPAPAQPPALEPPALPDAASLAEPPAAMPAQAPSPSPALQEAMDRLKAKTA